MKNLLAALLCVAAMGSCGCRAACADTLLVPEALERSGTTSAIYEIDAPGGGVLSVEWTDGSGRIADRQRINVGPFQRRVIIPLDLRRALEVHNSLQARLDRGGVAGTIVKASFVARPPADAWSDYQILMWQNHTAAQYRTLRTLGVTGAMLYAKSGVIDPAGVRARLDGDMPFYLENIATDLLAPYHLASSNARFEAAVKLFLQDPSSTAAFIRDPSLSDPVWLARLDSRLRAVVKAMSPYRPLFYNLGDETGIADIAAAWDFDLSAPSLAGMRKWLAKVYPRLDALNAEWGTSFKSWAEVTPMLTAEALRRSDDNLAAWGDFKAWMDLAYAHALQTGTDALHRADAKAVSAIEGVQVAGWGGYDLGRVPNAIDLMEFFNVGGNIEIAHSINPKLIVLSTSFGDGDGELHRLWREILLGARGHVIWEDGPLFLDGDNAIGPRGREAARYYPELRGGVVAQVMASTAGRDRIGVLYSQASFRTQWLLDARRDPKPWTDKRTPGDDNGAWRQSLNRVIDGLSHVGVQPRFIASDTLEKGVPAQIRLLILPDSVAMSEREVTAIKAFVGGGGHVVAIGEPAQFDQHSRRLAQPGLAGIHHLLRFPAELQGDAAPPVVRASLVRVLHEAGIEPGLTLSHPDGTPVDDVSIRHLRNGGVELYGLLRDFRPNLSLEPVVVTMAKPAVVTDLRGHRAFGRAAQFEVTLATDVPTLLAVSDQTYPALRVRGPDHARVGDVVQFNLASDGRTLADNPVAQAELLDPNGTALVDAGRNLRMPGGVATWTIPLAFNMPVGHWTIRITDILSGVTINRDLDVRAR